jgi:hypothetical protein
MNQFRDILMLAMIILAISLGVGHPENWTWETPAGPYAVQAVTWLTDLRPWSILLLLALALALFMTRLRF